MAVVTPRFSAKTERQLLHRLLERHTALTHSAESLRLDAAEANRGRDVSDLLDHEEPSADVDTQTILTLTEQTESLLREVQEALLRAASGTYGYCTACGRSIPLTRLRALPAAAACVECSRLASPRYVERRLLGETDDFEVAR